MSPFRLAVYNERQFLLGYWWLREQSVEGASEPACAVTCRHPISREFSLYTSTSADVLRHFFTSYIEYLHALVAQLEQALDNVPDEECRRPGFRPDHFRRTRRELISRRAQIICRSRERYAAAVTELRARGWPAIAPPPCFHVDISHAARSLT